jgi:hypothetical protein
MSKKLDSQSSFLIIERLDSLWILDGQRFFLKGHERGGLEFQRRLLPADIDLAFLEPVCICGEELKIVVEDEGGNEETDFRVGVTMGGRERISMEV